MTDPDNLSAALALAAVGWPVFPCMIDEHGAKIPMRDIVEHGFKEASTNPRRIRAWWRARPSALIGVAIPPGTVAVDVDDPDLFADAGLELPEAPTQQTPRGGYHKLYKTDGRRVKQTVKEIPGTDTRVGGRGYVIAWEPEQFGDVLWLPEAPEWLYAGDGDEPEEESGRRTRRVVPTATVKMGQRDNQLASMAGTMRRMGMGPDAIFGAFKAMLDTGQIEQTRDDKISLKDLQRIAGSIGSRQSDAVDLENVPEPETLSAMSIADKEFPPIPYLVAEIIPPGLGLIAGASKVGKSFFILQAAIEIASGGDLLDRVVETPRDVLYYALEDGERRLNHRMEVVRGDRQLWRGPGDPPSDDWVDIRKLEFRLTSPNLSDGLEKHIDKWLTKHPGGLVIIDVLAKVRPTSRGRGSAYDEDYSVLKEIHGVASSHSEKSGAAVIIITHTRKAGSDDFIHTFQGTTGIVGVSDWALHVERPRSSPHGVVKLVGRDIITEPVIEVLFNGTWHAVGTVHRGGSIERNEILDALRTEGPGTPEEISKYLNTLPRTVLTTRNGVNRKLTAMEGQMVRQLGRKKNGIAWELIPEEEIEAMRTASKSAATAATSHIRDKRDRRSFTAARITRADAGARGEPSTPSTHYTDHEDASVESVEAVEGGIPARRRTPMRTRTHGRES